MDELPLQEPSKPLTPAINTTATTPDAHQIRELASIHIEELPTSPPSNAPKLYNENDQVCIFINTHF